MPITLITGASRGLGRSMARHLASHGHDIILTYHSQRDKAEAVAASIRETGRKAAILPLDVAQSAAFPAFSALVREALNTHWGGGARAPRDNRKWKTTNDKQIPKGAVPSRERTRPARGRP